MPFIPNKPDPQRDCNDPEHRSPTHMVFPEEGGTWICPRCGFKTVIQPRPSLRYEPYIKKSEVGKLNII
jgi:hypothetical protein